MTCDIFSRSSALNLLRHTTVWFFGDSNTRSIYKDLVWLLQYGTMTPLRSFQMKNELIHANDIRTTNGTLHSGTDYEEERSYLHEEFDVEVDFMFITQHYAENFLRYFSRTDPMYYPDLLIINSGMWDISRYGPNSIDSYKSNLTNTMSYLRRTLPTSTRVIFPTILPISYDCRGGFITKDIESLRRYLPLHFVEANAFLRETAAAYEYDVLDLCYNARFLVNHWTPDGIHWSPKAYRLFTNLLLTHVAVSWEKQLPCVVPVSVDFLRRSHRLKRRLVVKKRNAVLEDGVGQKRKRVGREGERVNEERVKRQMVDGKSADELLQGCKKGKVEEGAEAGSCRGVTRNLVDFNHTKTNEGDVVPTENSKKLNMNATEGKQTTSGASNLSFESSIGAAPSSGLLPVTVARETNEDLILKTNVEPVRQIIINAQIVTETNENVNLAVSHIINELDTEKTSDETNDDLESHCDTNLIQIAAPTNSEHLLLEQKTNDNLINDTEISVDLNELIGQIMASKKTSDDRDSSETKVVDSLRTKYDRGDARAPPGDLSASQQVNQITNDLSAAARVTVTKTNDDLDKETSQRIMLDDETKDCENRDFKRTIDCRALNLPKRRPFAMINDAKRKMAVKRKLRKLKENRFDEDDDIDVMQWNASFTSFGSRFR